MIREANFAFTIGNQDPFDVFTINGISRGGNVVGINTAMTRDMILAYPGPSESAREQIRRYVASAAGIVVA